MPKVSVIMNCLNGKNYLQEAIDSVFDQTYTDWEIIFFDNNSKDNSASIAQKFGHKVRYFKSDYTMPLGKARNHAISQAHGEYIAFLDVDDMWMSCKLEKQIPLFSNNAVGLVFSDVVNLFQSEWHYYTQFSTLRKPPPRGRIFDYLLRQYGISMPSVVLRRSAISTLEEMFDESFKHSTDYDLFLRIAYDWECDYIAEPLAVYRIHQSLGHSLLGRYEAAERFCTLKKLCNLHPEIKYKYNSLINIAKRDIVLIQGKWFWKEGMVNEARNELKKYFYSPKIFLVFISTLLPYKLVMHLWSCYQEKINPAQRKRKFSEFAAPTSVKR
jgi:glycosyltransferase involved in cell wall biosynthesis